MKNFIVLLFVSLLSGCAGQTIKSSDSSVIKLRPTDFLEGEMSHYDWSGVYNTADNSRIFLTTMSGDKKATLGAMIDTKNVCNVEYMFVDSSGYSAKRKKIPNMTKKIMWNRYVWVEGVRFSSRGFTKVYKLSMKECEKIVNM